MPIPTPAAVAAPVEREREREEDLEEPPAKKSKNQMHRKDKRRFLVTSDTGDERGSADVGLVFVSYSVGYG